MFAIQKTKMSSNKGDDVYNTTLYLHELHMSSATTLVRVCRLYVVIRDPATNYDVVRICNGLARILIEWEIGAQSTG